MTSLMVEHLAYNARGSGSSPLLFIQIFLFFFCCQNGEIGIHAGLRCQSRKRYGFKSHFWYVALLAQLVRASDC